MAIVIKETVRIDEYKNLEEQFIEAVHMFIKNNGFKLGEVKIGVLIHEITFQRLENELYRSSFHKGISMEPSPMKRKGVTTFRTCDILTNEIMIF